MKMAIQIPKKFGFLFKPKRYKVMYGGRGGAKSHSIARALLVNGMEKPLRIICAREIQKSIADSVHALLSDLVRHHDLEDFYTVQNKVIRGANGTEFKFRGLKHNISDLKSLEGADIVWVEEAENVSNHSWEILIPTVRRDMSEIWISLNIKNVTDPTYKRFIAYQDENIAIVKVGWQDNPFFPDVLDIERRKLLAQDPEAYAHVWEGEPDKRRSGSVYASQLLKAIEDGRICKVPYDPVSEVFTGWDLGFGDATAIWWLQFVGRELRWLDYYENCGEQLDHYVKEIKSRPYNYMKQGHFLPHDGGHGNIRGESVSKQLTSMGLDNTIISRETDITPGLELVRQSIAYSAFDEKKCADGIHALTNYGYEWDENRLMFKKKPLHDWSSNGADAARTACWGASKVKSGFGRIITDNSHQHRYSGYHGSAGFMGV